LGRLLERESELALAETSAEAAREGSGSVLLFEGPAGIGKTELLAAAQRSVEEAGMEVLSARGGELEQSFGFGVVRQLFGARLDQASAAERRRLLEGAAGLAVPALGLAPRGQAPEAPPIPLVDPAASIQHGLHWLAANLAEEKPLLISVDDLHWSDPASVRWLVYLARRLEDLPMLVLAALRTGEAGLDPALLASLTGEPVTRILRPGALSEAASSELVRERLSPEAEAEFCSACHRASGGNPLFLSELIEAVREDGIPPTAAEAGRIEELTPEAISRSVLLRLARLPEGAEPIVRAVAVLGSQAEPRRAAALAEVSEEAGAALRLALTSASILAPGRPLQFVHPLLRTAVYEQIPGPERALAHGRAARMLADEGATAEEVAAQLLQSEPSAEEWALDTLRAAAAAALARGAPETAAAHLRRAFDEPASSRVRAELLQELLEVAVLTTARVFDGISDDWAAELSADPTVLMTSAPTLALALSGTGHYREAIEMLSRAAEAARVAGEDDHAIRIEAQLLAIDHELDYPAALSRLERYADRVKPGSAAEALWLALRAWWGSFGGLPRERCAEDARRALDSGHLTEEEARTPQAVEAIHVLIRAGEYEAAEDWIDRLAKHARGRGSALGFVCAAWFRGDLAYRRGDLFTAEAELRSAADVARERGFLLAVPMWFMRLTETLIERGQVEEAARELESAGVTGELPGNYWSALLFYSRAIVRAEQDRQREALGDLVQLLVTGAQGTFADAYPWGSTIALVLTSLGEDPEEARGFAEWELAEAQRWGTPHGIGVALRAFGLVEGGERGIELLEEAVAVLAPSEARLEHARALTDLGAAMRRAKRRTDARAVLKEAMDMAHRCGAVVLEERAREELAATGAKPRRVMLTGVESLTPSELRVARMAGEGMENKQIAQGLFVSVRTVETHLTHAYQKLDISSRKELVGALTEGAG
jgi:DNA-binding CsgD family transcriptional regulator